MKKAYLKYFFALLLFGSNGIVASNIRLPSYQIVLLRTLIGGTLLIVFFLFSRQKINVQKNKRDLSYIAVSGVAMGASWMLLYEAYAQIGVSIGTLTYYCGPVIVMILSPILFRERFSLFKIAGFLVVLTGLVLVCGTAAGDDMNPWGLFCGVTSAAAYAVMVIFNKKATRIGGLENAMLQLCVSFLTVAVFAAFQGGFAFPVRPGDWVWILVLGLLNTGAGCYFYFSSIGKLPVQTVAICGYLEPLSAVVFSAIFLKEGLLPLQMIGAVFMIGGAAFGEYQSVRLKR